MTAFVLIGVYLIKASSIWLWVGMGVTLVGEFIQLWAASQLKKNTVLATSGPYAHVRNPMYFGRFFVLLGFVTMVQQAWYTETQFYGIPTIAAVFIVAFVLYVVSRVGREEARLRSIFGKDYDDYCTHVGRFLPSIRPYSKTARQRLQWSQIVANHEYLNLIAVLFVYGLVFARLTYLKF